MVLRKLYYPDATQQHDNKDDEDDDPRRLALCRPGQSKNEQLGNRRRYQSKTIREYKYTIREYNFPVHTFPTHILSHFYALEPSGKMSLNFSAHQNKYSYTTNELIVHFRAP